MLPAAPVMMTTLPESSAVIGRVSPERPPDRDRGSSLSVAGQGTKHLSDECRVVETREGVHERRILSRNSRGGQVPSKALGCG